MADTVNATGLRVQQWDAKFFEEYVRENRFAPYMGTDENAVIQMKEDLTKKKGDRISLALVNKLSNAATTGTATLDGGTTATWATLAREPPFHSSRCTIPYRRSLNSLLMLPRSRDGGGGWGVGRLAVDRGEPAASSDGSADECLLR